ncbi:NAD(P)/FAD-dependent oxidoreductase [Achromobacter xylosoxidans]
MADADTILIIGAGQAGAVAAATLRELGHEGAITLVGQEAHAPYERPPLSKDALQTLRRKRPDPGASRRLLRTPAHHAADRRRGRAHRRQRRIARLADGRDLPYSRCLLATGGRARELPGLPRGTPGVHYIRTLDDAAALRAGLAPQARVAVIGGGFLGLEVASTARALGAEVTVLESAPRLLERVLPEALSDWLAERARHAGVDLRLGARIAGCDRQPQADAAVRRQARFSSPCRMPPPWASTSWWWPSA